jgi:hypothetical protein
MDPLSTLEKKWADQAWEQTEFSYETSGLLDTIKSRSQSDVSKLLDQYKKTWLLSLALLLCTPLLVLLKPSDKGFVGMVALLVAYLLILCAFLSFKLFRFRLPDMSVQPVEAIGQTLDLVRSINRFQATLIIYSTPLIFLASLLGTLFFQGHDFSSLVKDPLVVGIILVATALMMWMGKYVRKYLSSKQCLALIRQLEASRQLLQDERPDSV